MEVSPILKEYIDNAYTHTNPYLRLVTIRDFEMLQNILPGNPLVRVNEYTYGQPIIEVLYHRQHRRRITPNFFKDHAMCGLNLKFKKVSHKTLKEFSR